MTIQLANTALPPSVVTDRRHWSKLCG